jgi:catechol 2,3-dioxygenase-like lactoylglutathione lyase family enzyme
MRELRVCIDVPDLESAVAFYTRALGLTLEGRAGEAWVVLGGGPCPIDLVAHPPGSAPLPREASARRDYGRHWTPVHLDLVVDDLDAAVARAVAAGATLERGVDPHPWGRLAVLGDPFGHGFCLVERTGRGYDAVLTREQDPGHMA